MLTKAYAAQSPSTPLAPHEIERRAPRPNDVAIDILYCGVCHSDLHTVRGEWPGVLYPSVAGHEIVGRVSAIGSDVAKVQVGAFVGVGCLVDSCRTCAACTRVWNNIAKSASLGPTTVLSSAAQKTPMADTRRRS
jgi:alcohol dehydrogenase (NADP+)